MKQTRLLKILAAGAICAAAVGLAVAQTTTTTTTTDPVTGTTTTQQTTTSSVGNIVTYTPDSDSFMFRTSSDATPVRYYYTKEKRLPPRQRGHSKRVVAAKKSKAPAKRLAGAFFGRDLKCCSHRPVAGPARRCCSEYRDGPQGRGYSGGFPVACISRTFAAAWLHQKNGNRICKRKCTKCRTSRVCT